MKQANGLCPKCLASVDRLEKKSVVVRFDGREQSGGYVLVCWNCAHIMGAGIDAGAPAPVGGETRGLRRGQS